jgi:hypothetical protein
MKEIGESDDGKCYLICFLNFHGLLGYPLAVACIHRFVHQLLGGGGHRGGAEVGSFGTHKSLNHKTGDIICRPTPLFPSLVIYLLCLSTKTISNE